MKAKKVIRHGHSGNRKNVVVEWRHKKTEIDEAKAQGFDLNIDWKASPLLTQKTATEYRVRLEREGFQTREKNVYN